MRLRSPLVAAAIVFTATAHAQQIETVTVSIGAIDTINFQTIPEPSTALLGIGSLLFACVRCRR